MVGTIGTRASRYDDIVGDLSRALRFDADGSSKPRARFEALHKDLDRPMVWLVIFGAVSEVEAPEAGPTDMRCKQALVT